MVIKREIKEFLENELQAIKDFKRIMEFLCRVCLADCTREKKDGCTDFAIESAKSISNIRRNRKYERDEKDKD
jgi:hypothetical protein